MQIKHYFWGCFHNLSATNSNNGATLLSSLEIQVSTWSRTWVGRRGFLLAPEVWRSPLSVLSQGAHLRPPRTCKWQTDLWGESSFHKGSHTQSARLSVGPQGMTTCRVACCPLWPVVLAFLSCLRSSLLISSLLLFLFLYSGSAKYLHCL